MICKKCGNEIAENEKICSKCGTPTGNVATNAVQMSNEAADKCLGSFILGLIGAIFGIMGGLCTTMCDVTTGGNAPFFLIFCGSIIGLIGACMCLKRTKVGSVIELLAGIMIIICAFCISGAEFMSIIAMLLFLAGGIVGVVYSYVLKK